MSNILAVDVGTTALKLGVFSTELEKQAEASRFYEVNLYDRGKADIEPEKWWTALAECCHELKPYLSSIDIISFSVTTPGLVPMDANGNALGPAILFFDNRSAKQAEEIRTRVGEEHFLSETCNLPASGGSSLCSILWIKENQPEIWQKTIKFGHTNTYMLKRFTGEWAIDPSTISITGLYNSARHDLTYNQKVLESSGIPEEKLPRLMHSYQCVGKIRKEIADELGLPCNCDVLCGGNDAVLAAFSSDFIEHGKVSSICGTCDITYVCVEKPVSSKNFNVRCHVVPNRWVTFFVLNTGGIALDWFHSVFCQELSKDQFYAEYVPHVLSTFFDSENKDELELDIPEYSPFLQGSRYSLEKLTAGFTNLSLETDRDKMLLGLIRGNAVYHGEHLKEVSAMVELNKNVLITGGAAKIKGYLDVKKRWTGNFEYEFQDQSSLLGAAKLVSLFRDNE
ncbi:MAG: hypothetical protein HQM13_17900 [SAR324 cluster bacterium]|nr:hypothetical protein [SAR324 cluster bacterium]